MIYLDHAATSWPKPSQVIKAMADFLEHAGGNPGRSGHRLSIAAGRVVYDARENIATLLGASDPLRLIFTLNATHALNIALHGYVRAGFRVVTTGIEHNSVMRPLRILEKQGVHLTVMACASDGSIDVAQVKSAVKPGTNLVVINHASNVAGTILPVAEIASIAHRAGALLLVDAAQTAGVVPINMEAMGIDMLAFTGHKGLLGPPGTGGLIFGSRVDTSQLTPLLQGGTGSRSEFEIQPEDCPDKFESGTGNGAGIAGLSAGVAVVVREGVASIRAHEIELTRMLVDGLRNIPGVHVYGPQDYNLRTATVSFTVPGLRVSDIGLRLDEDFAVLCRVGLHCAPAAHRTLGTFPDGTVRLAAGWSTTPADIRTALSAVTRIVQK